MAADVKRKSPADLRSHRWFGKDDFRSFGHRSRAKQAGFSAEDIAGKPVIAILNTWSDANPCHTHFKMRAEEVKRGVWQAGGFPMEIPVLTLGETFMKPSTMLYRNLLAMDAEEALRAYPADGVVLLGGCDKTVPALVMGATSANLPAIFVPAGPMLRGNWRGQILGSGTDAWKYWDEKRAGTARRLRLARDGGRHRALVRHLHDDGHGVDDGGGGGCARPDAARGVVDSRRRLVASAHGLRAPGRRIVEMVWEDLTPRDILTTEAFENAVTAAMALGGSTNAIIHSIAMAGRAGAALDLDRFDALSRRTPFLANIRPSGQVPDGGLLLRGRPARRARSAARSAAHRLPDRHRPDARRGARGRDGLQRRGDRAARARRSGRRGASPCCAAISRPTAPSSSTPPPSAGCCSTPGPAVVFTNYDDLGGADRRSVTAGDRGLGAGAAERRSARRPGDAGVGHAADPEEAARSRACATWCGSPTRG